jgi:hypothetical protein
MKFRYRTVDRWSAQLNRRKDTLILTIPTRWNLDPDNMREIMANETGDREVDQEAYQSAPNTGNEFATQFATQAALRLKTAHETIEDDNKFIRAVNTIIFIYLTHYHYMDEIYYREIDHGQEPDWSERGDTIIRDQFAAFGDILRRTASRLRDIDNEAFQGWNDYYNW